MYIYNHEYLVGSNVLTASAAVLVFDFFITFDDEINYVWLKPLTTGTLLFTVNRYLVFINTLMALFLEFTATNLVICYRLYATITWLIACGLMAAESVLLLRTYAIWQKNRRILGILGGMSMLTFVPGIYLTVAEVDSFKFSPVPPGGLGCNLTSASKNIMISFVLIAISETVVVVLTIIKGREHLRNSKHSWVKRIYQDGLIFYIYLLIITVANIVVPNLAPAPQYKNYLAVLQHVIHSIVCNRVILTINKQRSRAVEGVVGQTTGGVGNDPRPRSLMTMTKTHLSGTGMLDHGNEFTTRQYSANTSSMYSPYRGRNGDDYPVAMGDRDLDLGLPPEGYLEEEVHEMETMQAKDYGDWTR